MVFQRDGFAGRDRGLRGAGSLHEARRVRRRRDSRNLGGRNQSGEGETQPTGDGRPGECEVIPWLSPARASRLRGDVRPRHACCEGDVFGCPSEYLGNLWKCPGPGRSLLWSIPACKDVAERRGPEKVTFSPGLEKITIIMA